jgi:hypothetical protein
MENKQDFSLRIQQKILIFPTSAELGNCLEKFVSKFDSHLVQQCGSNSKDRLHVGTLFKSVGSCK